MKCNFIFDAFNTLIFKDELRLTKMIDHLNKKYSLTPTSKTRMYLNAGLPLAILSECSEHSIESLRDSLLTKDFDHFREFYSQYSITQGVHTSYFEALINGMDELYYITPEINIMMDISKHGHKISVISNCHFYHKDIIRTLLSDYSDTIVYSCSAGYAKPDLNLFTPLTEYKGFKTVVVGDSWKSDMKMAENFNVIGFYVGQSSSIIKYLRDGLSQYLYLNEGKVGIHTEYFPQLKTDIEKACQSDGAFIDRDGHILLKQHQNIYLSLTLRDKIKDML